MNATGNSLATALIAAAALLGAGATDRANAQLFPWGGWQSNSPWQAQPRRQRRPRRHVEPKESKEELASTLPTPEGPLLLVVSLGKQTVTVYDGTKKIATAPVSSGMRGRETPTGIFSLLEKNRYHYSNLYGGAPMPFMQRVTNSGVALHAGHLPGYPASHGCIRMPYSFARKLFGITDIGARVIVNKENPAPLEFESAHLIAPLPPGGTDGTASGFKMSGVTPAAAAGMPKVRTRAMAEAARAAEREQLAAAITVAENGKTSAKDHVKLTAELAHKAKDAIRKARRAADRAHKAARKAQRAAKRGESRFADLTRKMAAIDIKKIDAAELEKKKAEELEEEAKVVELAAAAKAAKALAAKRKHEIGKAKAAAERAEKVQHTAREDAKTAEQTLADAKAALEAAELIEKRKEYPVSIFVSAKTGRLVAKLGFAEVIDVPVTIADPDKPLGTHVLTATAYTGDEKAMRWTAVTVNPNTHSKPPRRRKRRHEDEAHVVPAGPNADAESALERIQIPEETRARLSELMKPGSSFIISDYPLSRETSERTEFVIEPWRSRGGGYAADRTVDYY